MNPSPAGMPRELLRRIRAHNYQTRTRRLELVREGTSALEGYTPEEIRIVLPGRKIEWLTSFGTARNAVVHPTAELVALDDESLTFLNHEGVTYSLHLNRVFTVSSKHIFHRIRAPRKVRNVR